MFTLFRLLFKAVKAVASVIAAVVKTVVAVVKFTIRQVTMHTGRYSPGWDFFINRQVNWKRAMNSQEEMDAERDRIIEALEDNDNNGIPDLYDAEITTPQADFLGIKYPDTLLVENDYVRYLPRRLGVIPQPVNIGGKGLVRSETISNMGQHVMIKWNALNPMGAADAPLYRCNSMDVWKIGHVYGAHLTR